MSIFSAEHSYYCSSSNFRTSEYPLTFPSWGDFLVEFKDSDMDLNLVFRWDVWPKDDADEKKDTFTLEVFILKQRKGEFMPCVVTVRRDDETSIVDFLRPRWEHMKALWEPLSTEEVKS